MIHRIPDAVLGKLVCTTQIVYAASVIMHEVGWLLGAQIQ